MEKTAKVSNQSLVLKITWDLIKRFDVPYRLATQEDDSTRKEAESDDIDREGSTHDNSMGQNLIIPQTRKRKSNTAWESNIAKKRKGICVKLMLIILYQLTVEPLN